MRLAKLLLIFFVILICFSGCVADGGDSSFISSESDKSIETDATSLEESSEEESSEAAESSEEESSEAPVQSSEEASSEEESSEEKQV